MTMEKHLSPEDIQALSTQTPLIWTAKGNQPIEALTLRFERHDEVDQIILVEIYELNGEIVRRSPHVLPLAPWQTGKGGRLEQTQLNGEAGSISGAGPTTAGGVSQ